MTELEAYKYISKNEEIIEWGGKDGFVFTLKKEKYGVPQRHHFLCFDWITNEVFERYRINLWKNGKFVATTQLDGDLFLTPEHYIKIQNQLMRYYEENIMTTTKELKEQANDYKTELEKYLKE